MTVVPVERSFSTLKRLNTYLTNTMGEERLNGLALMNVHRGIPLDIDGVLDRMSKKTDISILFCSSLCSHTVVIY